MCASECGELEALLVCAGNPRVIVDYCYYWHFCVCEIRYQTGTHLGVNQNDTVSDCVFKMIGKN